METKVANVRVTHLRPKYNNLQEWMNDSNNVYVGRGRIVYIDGIRFPPNDSLWCNPFKGKNTTREENIAKFEKYIREKIEKENLLDELKKIKGKTLGCWCHPENCHADVLVKLVNELIS